MRQELWNALLGAVVGAGLLAGSLPLSGSEMAPLLARIKAVGSEGAGNADAAKAWKQLVQGGVEALPPILAALDDADATSANWLRAAVDAIAERETTAGRPLPADNLEAFVLDTKHKPEARRLAYEWLTRVDPKTPGRLLPGMLNDPSKELRRDAVAVVLVEAKGLLDKQDKAGATAAYRKALTSARDKDQVELIAKQLKPLGVEVDLAAHFGFIQPWMLVAPFDNTGGTGYGIASPPEKHVDLTAAYKGKGEAEVRWVEHVTSDPYGIVNLNKVLGQKKGAIAYAYAAIDSPAERQVEVRAGCINALKIFLNGKPIFTREEYHHGMSMDQHVAFGTLQAGRNELLVKVCQNEQTEMWAQEWSFQVRLCDAAGNVVPFTVVGDKAKQPEKGKVP
jgi:hypothetical protein